MASTAVTAASEDAEGVGPLPVTALEAHGVNGGDIKKLREAGYNTIESIVYAPKKNLLAIKGISEAKADKIMAEGQKMVPTGFTTATAMHLKRSQLIQVSRTKENLISIHPFQPPRISNYLHYLRSVILGRCHSYTIPIFKNWSCYR